jgi:hypothetical protein
MVRPMSAMQITLHRDTDLSYAAVHKDSVAAK